VKLQMIVVCCAALALSVGVATATAGNGNGGNSANAKLCQKGGWQNLVRADQTAFKNEGDCVSYGAKGETLTPSCIAGSEDWSGFASGSRPTTFAGGTIEGPYGADIPPFHNAGIDGGFEALNTGLTTVSFRLTFTKAVKPSKCL
jgi:hypothetical protein